jgi:nicotinate-nucleotide--dimethylbenzimidazole phosphoribosyltransferase
MQKNTHTDLVKLAQEKLDNKTKPVGSLGVLETVAAQLAAIQGSLSPQINLKRMLIFAASHGVTAEGISAYPAEVTGQMVLNFLTGGAAINVLARHGNMQLYVIDVGVDADLPEDVRNVRSFFSKRVSRGTRNFAKEPAMTVDECEVAMKVGREQVDLAMDEQVEILGIGEMGIGNTTAAAALFSAILGIEPEVAVGPGTGLDAKGIRHKADVVRNAIELHRPSAKSDALSWLRSVGGFEIAAMVGVILEATRRRMPVVVDGFIATSAAAVAFEIEPAARQVCFFGHCSDEKAHRMVLDRLNVQPILDLKMRLGEGTGAALAMHLIEAGAKVLCEMATFESAGVSSSANDANRHVSAGDSDNSENQALA